MAYLELDSSLLLASHQLYHSALSPWLVESMQSDAFTLIDTSTPSPSNSNNIPARPPVSIAPYGRRTISSRRSVYVHAADESRDCWDRLFGGGYEADVKVLTDDMDVILAHSGILGITSPVLKKMFEKASKKGGYRCIRIRGVPSQAARAFLRFLYSARYEDDVMKKFVLHLLVMSHIYCIPALKTTCIKELELGMLNTENAVDFLQLARQCDAPRLSLLCTRLIVKDFKIISASEGWKEMKTTNQDLEQEILEALVDADSKRQETLRKAEEKNMYMQLYEAMEALLHICNDGCRTIGPRDKVLKDSRTSCKFPACKAIESLVRHFSGCKKRVPGGCAQCKRMSQLFELHSWMCNEADSCKVPLCRHFKDKVQNQNKKEDLKWKLLVCRVMTAKGTISSICSRRFLFP